MSANKKTVVKRRGAFYATALLNVTYTFNNFFVTLTTLGGDVLLQKSPRMLGFNGKRRGTPAAMQATVAEVVRLAKERFGVEAINIFLRGPGIGRDTSPRIAKEAGMEVRHIEGDISVPHNGTRPPKRRRV